MMSSTQNIAISLDQGEHHDTQHYDRPPGSFQHFRRLGAACRPARPLGLLHKDLDADHLITDKDDTGFIADVIAS